MIMGAPVFALTGYAAASLVIPRVCFAAVWFGSGDELPVGNSSPARYELPLVNAPFFLIPAGVNCSQSYRRGNAGQLDGNGGLLVCGGVTLQSDLSDKDGGRPSSLWRATPRQVLLYPVGLLCRSAVWLGRRVAAGQCRAQIYRRGNATR